MKTPVAIVKGKTMAEHNTTLTMKGKPLKLSGPKIGEGDKAPDAELVANDLSPAKLADFLGKKVCVISSVPSLDTSVCDKMTRRFNEEMQNLDNVTVLTISMDLPFAQKRWCGAAGIKNVITLSDYQKADFATTYGLLIEELRLLARAVMVIDNNRVIRHFELVNEITDEPDYDAAINTARQLQ